MELGYFAMPSHPPECGLKEGHDWDLQVLRWLDELGYQEAWIGEHHTAPWEPHPAPDLLVVEGLRQTKNIRLGPGGFLLPYHHPAELANRVAMLDHISGGRLNFGVAASGLPSDWAMFNVDGMSGVNRDMTREALDIILKLWSSTEPFDYKGKFWNVSHPPEMFGFLRHHIRPLQKPHPPIGVAGISKGSDTLKLAGEKGFLPMSLNLNPAYVGSHWEAVEIGAAKAGRTPDRGEWRMVRERGSRADRSGSRCTPPRSPGSPRAPTSRSRRDAAVGTRRPSSAARRSSPPVSGPRAPLRVPSRGLRELEGVCRG